MSTIKLKVSAVLESVEVLRRITGTTDEKSNKSMFSFSFKAKQLLAKRLRLLCEEVDAIEERRKGFIEEFKIKGDDSDTQENIKKYNDAWIKFNKEEVILECGTIDASLLDFDKNDIPTAYLTVLDWLIVFNEDAEEKPKAE